MPIFSMALGHMNLPAPYQVKRDDLMIDDRIEGHRLWLGVKLAYRAGTMVRRKCYDKSPAGCALGEITRRYQRLLLLVCAFSRATTSEIGLSRLTVR